MAQQDRYYIRVYSGQPYTDGQYKFDIEYFYGLYDTVAHTYSNVLSLRHQDVLVTYAELNAISVNPLNDTTVKKRQAMYALLKDKVAIWRTDESFMAKQNVDAWMPGTWPLAPEDIVLR